MSAGADWEPDGDFVGHSNNPFHNPSIGYMG
jgi:hypothetical protein